MSQIEYSERDGNLALDDGDGDEDYTWVSLTVAVDETHRQHTVHLPTTDPADIAEAIGECLRAIGASMPDLGIEMAMRGL